jgi:hypothetical protein
VKISNATARILSALDAPADPRPARSTIPIAAGPVVLQLSDPVGDVEDIAAAFGLEDAGVGIKPNGYLQRRRAAQRMGARPSGLVTFEGRVCCVRFLRSLDRRLHLLKLPYETECDECGAEYRIEMGVVRHGRI